MTAARHTFRVFFTPAVHIRRADKDAIAKRLGGARVRRHLWSDFITVAGCRTSLIAAAGALWGWPHVVAVEDDAQRVTLAEDWPAAIARAQTLGALEGLVTGLRYLSDGDRAPLRPLWLARRAQLRGQAAEFEEGLGLIRV